MAALQTLCKSLPHVFERRWHGIGEGLRRRALHYLLGQRTQVDQVGVPPGPRLLPQIFQRLPPLAALVLRNRPHRQGVGHDHFGDVRLCQAGLDVGVSALGDTGCIGCISITNTSHHRVGLIGTAQCGGKRRLKCSVTQLLPQAG